MRVYKRKRPRKFVANKKTNLILSDVGKITLNKNEHITIQTKNKKHDICAMNWGFYATSSLNRRLKLQGFKTFLVKNFYNKLFVMIVENRKKNLFKKYCKQESLRIVMRLDTIK